MGFKTKWARLLFIDRKIGEGSYPNSHSLAKEWEGVSYKTIQRDIDYMRDRSEEHTSELQSHSFISYAVFCLKKKICRLLLEINKFLPLPGSSSLYTHHSTYSSTST